MPVKPPPGFRLGAIQPNDAVAAFEARGLLRPSFRWQDVWQAEHARSFAVAGVMRLDILSLIHDQVGAAVANGTGLEEFSAALARQLVRKGFWGDIEVTDPQTGELRTTKFDEQRLQFIFDVNMRQSAAAGRWARGIRSGKTHIIYRTMEDERVRLSHRPWDWLCLPVDHPIWDTHFPPCGWRCRCYAYFVNQREIDVLLAAGKPLKFMAPEITYVEFRNRSTGQVERVPRGIDPGFAYNPGKAHVQRGVELLERGLGAVQPTTPDAGDALRVTEAVIARARRESGFASFLEQPPPLPAGQRVGMPVAALPAMEGEPRVVSVAASDLIAQASTAEDARALPTRAAAWTLAQAVVDQGQRLDLGGGRVLWWRVVGSGDARRVQVFEAERSALVWWARHLATLGVDEAVQRYPRLQGLL